MAFRFWRRMRLAPGVTLNLSKSTASLSFGPRGAKYTVSPLGNRATVGLTGTGLFYTTRHSPGAHVRAAQPAAERNRLNPGFFKRLMMRSDDRALIDGLRELSEGDETAALDHFERASTHADASWIAGMLRFKREDFSRARAHLQDALANADALGRALSPLGVTLELALPVTAEVTAHAEPSEHSTVLALVEIAQHEGDMPTSLAYVERLLNRDATDPLALVSFAELLFDTGAGQQQLQRLVSLTAGVDNATPVHTALLLYRGRALTGLGLQRAAIDAFTLGLRRRKGRAEGLLRQIRYERAVLYEETGRSAHARGEFERIYGEDPNFEDVRARLGLNTSDNFG